MFTITDVARVLIYNVDLLEGVCQREAAVSDDEALGFGGFVINYEFYFGVGVGGGDILCNDVLNCFLVLFVGRAHERFIVEVNGVGAVSDCGLCGLLEGE